MSEEAESQEIMAQVTEPAAHKTKIVTTDFDADIGVGQKLAGNISSSVVSILSTTMDDEADNIFAEVDSIMGSSI